MKNTHFGVLLAALMLMFTAFSTSAPAEARGRFSFGYSHGGFYMHYGRRHYRAYPYAQPGCVREYDPYTGTYYWVCRRRAYYW